MQGHHKRKVGVVIRFLWECSSGGERVVRSDSVVGIGVEYFVLSRADLQLRVREWCMELVMFGGDGGGEGFVGELDGSFCGFLVGVCIRCG